MLGVQLADVSTRCSSHPQGKSEARYENDGNLFSLNDLKIEACLPMFRLDTLDSHHQGRTKQIVKVTNEFQTSSRSRRTFIDSTGSTTEKDATSMKPSIIVDTIGPCSHFRDNSVCFST